jgi:hypothetical protein
MSRSRIPMSLLATGLVVGAVAMSAGPADATYDPPSLPVVDRAIAYLATQQLPSGGFDGDVTFEGTTFPASDFATSETVLAIAEHAQTSTSWSTARAAAAVRGLRRDGRSPLDFLDGDVASSVSAGKAAKMVVLVAAPLGLDARRFDPAGNGDPIDLVARIDDGLRADGSYAAGAINSTLFAMLANRLLDRPVGATTVAYVRSAQQPNGGWSFDGNPSSATAATVDTTARAVQALVAAGVPAGDAVITRALGFLAQRQAADGGWGDAEAFEDRIASTALASVAIEAAGYTTVSSCWRDSAAPARRGQAYVSPDAFLRTQQLASGEMASAFGGSFSTAQGVQGLLRRWQPGAAAAVGSCPVSGYRIVGADGGVFALGTASFRGSAAGVSRLPIVDAIASRSGNGYLLVASDGGVFAYGDAVFRGSTGALRLNAPIVGAAATPTGGGYWLFAADGGVFAYGDASFFGSAAGVSRERIVGGAPTATGQGYWLFAADGGVFSYGDARFRGSAAGVATAPIVAGAASPQGDGYALFAENGAVFTYGFATTLPAELSVALPRIVDGTLAPGGRGWYLLGADGGVFAFGAPFAGSAAGLGSSPAVAISG